MSRFALAPCAALLVSCLGPPVAAQKGPVIEYRVLATNKTSTMQKEMQQAAEAGFRFGDVMGGDTAFGGSEVVVIMHRGAAADRFDYRLLATNKTSTMQKEMQEGGDAGFEYRGQTVFNGMTVAKTLVGGDEVVAILRRKLQCTVVAGGGSSSLSNALPSYGQ